MPELSDQDWIDHWIYRALNIAGRETNMPRNTRDARARVVYTGDRTEPRRYTIAFDEISGEALAENESYFDPAAEMALRDIPTNSVGEYKTLTADHPEYGTHLNLAFNFFRRNAEGRYSNTSLIRITDTNDQYRSTPTSNIGLLNLPIIIACSSPFSYDEETEVKTGGINGMIITWPNDKALIAVSNGLRRRGIGSQMLRIWRNSYACVPGSTGFWVGRRNVDGQIFLLSNGFLPSAMNGTGAMRYTYGTGFED